MFAHRTCLFCFLFFFLCFLFVYSDDSHLLNHDTIPRIAIIGAGAGGSSSAFFIRKFAGNEIDIDVFEKNNVPGGRVKSMDISGEHVELGGSIYHKENKLFSDFVKMGKFKTFDPIHGHTDPNAKEPKDFIPEKHELGVWNGKEMVFKENAESNILNIINGLWRYGLDPKYVSSEADRILHEFLNVYELLDNNSYNTVEELLTSLHLLNLTKITLEEHLFSNGYCSYNSGKYCHEIVTGLTRVNYGQSMDMNALVGLIALVGSSDDIVGVVDGNYKVMEYALWRANSIVRYNSVVNKITKQDNSKYSISYIDSDQNQHIITDYDKIVIACPLEFANLEIEGFELPSNGMQKRPYQVTHVTMIIGELNLKDYFGFPESVTQPQMIITTEDTRAEFSSIFLHSDYNAAGNIRKMYKIFSREKLSDKKIGELFNNITYTYQTEFSAYPVLNPLPKSVPFPPINLDKGNVYYVNAMESAFSTIETEMISGKNIAKLIANSLSTEDIKLHE